MLPAPLSWGMDMDQAEIERLRAVLEQQPDIRLALLFGSLAEGRARAGSDLDIAIRCDQPLSAERRIELIGNLAQACGRAIDLIDLNRVGVVLLGQILRQPIRLIGSSSEQAELLSRYLIDSADFLPIYNRILRERREAWINS